MNYLVYHNSDFIDYSLRTKIQMHLDLPRLNPDHMTLVCKVRADSIEDAYRLTNHIDYLWWRNPEIVWWRESRSTSVGDLIHNMDDGSYSIVAPFGFDLQHPWWITAHMLEKDLPDEPQVFVDIFAVNRSLNARFRRLVLRQLYRIRTHLKLPFLRE